MRLDGDIDATDEVEIFLRHGATAIGQEAWTVAAARKAVVGVVFGCAIYFVSAVQHTVGDVALVVGLAGTTCRRLNYTCIAVTGIVAKRCLVRGVTEARSIAVAVVLSARKACVATANELDSRDSRDWPWKVVYII